MNTATLRRTPDLARVHLERLEAARGSGLGRMGQGHLVITAAKLHKVELDGDHVWLDRLGRLHISHSNAYVNTGLNNALDLEWGLGGTAIGSIGVDNNTTAVTATTTFLHGAGAGTAATTIIKSISPAATRTAQTTTGGSTFVNADFTSGVFVWNKIGLLKGAGAADNGSNLIDVIGGTGGVSPYNRTFVLDLTAAGTFSVVAQIADTATAI